MPEHYVIQQAAWGMTRECLTMHGFQQHHHVFRVTGNDHDAEAPVTVFVPVPPDALT
jgi:hypothetical protein